VHFKTPKVGVSLLVEDQGRVLLVQRGIEPGLGQWGLPSGFLECDETPEEGARRECEEETGALVEDLEILDVSAYADDFRGAGINLTYRARFAGGPVAPGDDAMQVAWVRPGQLPTGGEIAFHSHRALLQRWRLESE
jgi:ADP-ribose pyrophosphatase YjhB (NUDIX family)